ncbi:MAG: RDD family protein [Ahrensia sp.]|nr:RDD family protein [Ahrensia sp.]
MTSLTSNKPQTDWHLLEGVRSRRIGAFLIDYGMVALLMVLAVPLVAVLGFATFGAGWLLYAILGPLVALSYIWWTVGGPRQASWGMQIMNIKLVRYDNAKIDGMTAIVHAVLFWAQSAIFFPLLLAPLILGDKRTLHDLAMGTLVVRDR